MNFSKINIVFICGSLEPGKDGVGDYTRRLAGELKRQGSSAAIIAINDQYINQTTEDFLFDEEINIFCLRIPTLVQTDQKIESCKKIIDYVNPNWISIQYVPYSFHKKGIPLLLGSFLSKINQKAKWHVMLHEVCIGSQVGIKNKLISFCNYHVLE